MASCLIFCAGGFDGLLAMPEKDDYILAADGGFAHVQALGLTPHGVLGDFDSLGYVPEDAKIFPVEKDDTDAMLAVRHGLSLGYKQFLLYGALEGPRLDHTVANLQTLLFLADHGARGHLIGRSQIVTIIKNTTLHIPAGSRGTVSVFCMGQDAEGVTIRGLQYSLENSRLSAGFPLGVSNHFTGKAASITVKTGSLLIIYGKENGIL